MKEIDLNKTLYEITEEYPELIPVFASLGFAGVTNEELRTTHGKVMTIVKGCKHLGISLNTVKSELAKIDFSTKV